MSTTTFRTTDAFGPLLVSELPPLSVVPAPRTGLLARVQDELALRRQARTFARALGSAGPAEQGDLIALSRRG
jgi:hypothetical protein